MILVILGGLWFLLLALMNTVLDHHLQRLDRIMEVTCHVNQEITYRFVGTGQTVNENDLTINTC